MRLCALFLFPCIAFSQVDTTEQQMISTFNRWLRDADNIVIGKTISTQTVHDSCNTNYKYPITSVTFKIFKVLKGDIHTSTFEFKTIENELVSVLWGSGYHNGRYNTGELAIYYFKNKDRCGYVDEVHRDCIIGGDFERTPVRDGAIYLGNQLSTSALPYIDLIRRSLLNPIDYSRYIHMRFVSSKPQYKNQVTMGLDRSVTTTNRTENFNHALFDTSEQTRSKSIQHAITNSEVIVDAQVISMEPKWIVTEKGKKIHTTVKFKVLQTIKGTVQNNEVSYDCPGGSFSDDSTKLTVSPRFKLNDRMIAYFSKMSADSIYIIGKFHKVDNGQVKIFYHTVSVDKFIEVIKMYVRDRVGDVSYFHRLMENEN